MSAMEPINTHEFPLDHEPIEAWQVRGSAEVTTAFAELGSIGGTDYGLWEMSVGSMRDVEGDEVFLVLSGTGRIEFEESTRPDIELAPGSLVRLNDGETTLWTITEAPLRKLFIAPSEG